MRSLTVGIPVHDEMAYLSKTVAHLVDLIGNGRFDCEVVIVDNYSQDGTREYLMELHESCHTFSRLEVIFNPQNMGFGHSCDTLMSRSQTEYLWIIGAQDLISEEGLVKILRSISEGPSLIVCNASMRDEGTGQIINTSLWGDLKEQTFQGYEDFFDVMGGPCQAVSCNIFRVQDIKPFISIPQITHYWGYYERICDLLVTKGHHATIHYSAYPAIEILMELSNVAITGISEFGSSPRREFGGFFTALELAELMIHKFGRSRTIFTINVHRDLFALPRIMLVARSRGLRVDLKLLMRMVHAYRARVLFWVVLPFVLVVPFWMLRGIEKMRPVVHLLRRVFNLKTF